MSKISSAVKKETGYVALWVLILSAILQGVFLVCGRWTVYILADNAVTAVFSVLNFFIMGLTVQKAVGKSEQQAASLMKVSQMLRNLMMAIVIVGGVVIHMQSKDGILELFPNIIALFLPAFFPRFAILVRSKTLKNEAPALKDESDIDDSDELFEENPEDEELLPSEEGQEYDTDDNINDD